MPTNLNESASHQSYKTRSSLLFSFFFGHLHIFFPQGLQGC
jgi:hypothetical protein